MARKVLISCAILLLSLVSTASAKQYLGLGVMAVMLEDADLSGDIVGEASFDAGWGAMAFVGSKMELFRVEGEVAYRRSDIDRVVDFSQSSRGGNAEALSAMFNVYLDFGRYEFRPFLGAGAGAARIKADFAGVSDRDTVFAYQGIAGVALGGGLDLGYRYFATEDPTINGTDAEYKSHSIYLAYRF
jgi:opacity protein-like surface antigen